ncbi:MULTISPECIES: hypothetical protein [Vibrio]|uniref:hypothetical protein n=1 Tax=Vibrio TaxID=662 RepID=UPI0002E79C52|nr:MULTISPECIES: hypothetical protein [Vibrio]MCG9544803.1 hypothetical protein [Vibrio sp. Isolate33]OEE95862.1 hypothetical protein A138_19830 [Vibrio crassostreae 9ZC77]
MKTRLLALTSALVVSTSSFADDSAVTTAINGAVSSGQSNYGLVVVGLIGLGALGFGLRAIMGAMRG